MVYRPEEPACFGKIVAGEEVSWQCGRWILNNLRDQDFESVYVAQATSNKLRNMMISSCSQNYSRTIHHTLPARWVSAGRRLIEYACGFIRLRPERSKWKVESSYLITKSTVMLLSIGKRNVSSRKKRSCKGSCSENPKTRSIDYSEDTIAIMLWCRLVSRIWATTQSIGRIFAFASYCVGNTIVFTPNQTPYSSFMQHRCNCIDTKYWLHPPFPSSRSAWSSSGRACEEKPLTFERPRRHLHHIVHCTEQVWTWDQSSCF